LNGSQYSSAYEQFNVGFNINSLVITSNNSRIIVGGSKSTGGLIIYDYPGNTWTQFYTYGTTYQNVTDVVLSTDGLTLVFVNSKTIYVGIYNTSSRIYNVKYTINQPNGGTISTRVSANGTKIIAQGFTQDVVIYYLNGSSYVISQTISYINTQAWSTDLSSD
jgi:WD40 repeat protein